MALYRTKQERIERYTEGWPADLIPARSRDLSRHANFDAAYQKRAPYEAGDGIEDWTLLVRGRVIPSAGVRGIETPRRETNVRASHVVERRTLPRRET